MKNLFWIFCGFFSVAIILPAKAMTPSSMDMAAINDNTPWYDKNDCNVSAFTNIRPYGLGKLITDSEDIAEDTPDDLKETYNIPQDDPHINLKLPGKVAHTKKAGTSYSGNGYKLYNGKVALMPGGYTIYENGVNIQGIIDETNKIFGFEYFRNGGHLDTPPLPKADSDEEDPALEAQWEQWALTTEPKHAYFVFIKGQQDNCPTSPLGVVGGCAGSGYGSYDGLSVIEKSRAVIIHESQHTNLHELGHMMGFDHYASSELMKPQGGGASSWPSAEREGLMKMYNALEDGWITINNKSYVPLSMASRCDGKYVPRR